MDPATLGVPGILGLTIAAGVRPSTTLALLFLLVRQHFLPAPQLA